MLIQPTHMTYKPMSREPPCEVSSRYGQILPAPTLCALHYTESSTHDYHPYHASQHQTHTEICDLLLKW